MEIVSEGSDKSAGSVVKHSEELTERDNGSISEEYLDL